MASDASQAAIALFPTLGALQPIGLRLDRCNTLGTGELHVHQVP